MKLKNLLIAALVIAFSNAYADDPSTTQQGAAEYDWQACVNAKLSTCISACANSEDPSCNDDCNDIAADKCQAEGKTPPQ